VTPYKTIGDVLKTARTELSAAGIASAHLDARVLVGHALGMTSTEVFIGSQRPLSEADAERIGALTARRRSHEPVAYITGEREFWGLRFAVTPATLIPRPDSETVVEAVLSHIGDIGRDVTILDLGVGSGCLLLSVLHELPNARGVGLDISPDALAVARHNAAALGLESRASWICSNWASSIRGHFDIVIANPPYVRLDDRESLAPDITFFEPQVALYGGTNGLAAYDSILPDLPRLLHPHGRAFLEIGAKQVNALKARATRHGLASVDLYMDLGDRPRCLSFHCNASAAKKSLECNRVPTTVNGVVTDII